MPSGGSATSSWKDAMQACFDYLVQELSYEANRNAFLGDTIPDTISNVFVFILSGGREQVQNYQISQPGNPGAGWFVNGASLGQFNSMDDAMNFAGRIQDAMPPNKQPGSARGLPPNVQLFEATTHPDLFSRSVVDGEDERTFWMTRQDYRCVYNNTKT